MSKRKRKEAQFDEFDTEFFAQLDFLGNDYGNALETIEQQEKDIQKLMVNLAAVMCLKCCSLLLTNLKQHFYLQ